MNIQEIKKSESFINDLFRLPSKIASRLHGMRRNGMTGKELSIAELLVSHGYGSFDENDDFISPY